MKEKYENEIRDMEFSEKESKTKYNEIKAKLLETESVVLNLTNNIKQLEQQLCESREVCATYVFINQNLFKNCFGFQFAQQLSDDRNRMKEIVKAEVKDELTKMANEIQMLKDEKEKEMQQVYSR